MPAWLLWYLAIGSMVGVGFAFLVDAGINGDSFLKKYGSKRFGAEIKVEIETDAPSMDTEKKISYELYRPAILTMIALIGTVLWPLILFSILTRLAISFHRTRD